MSQNKSKNSEILNELNWIRIQDDDMKIESFSDKLTRKMTENPAVPIGCIATVAALSYGLLSFYRGNSLMSQYMMRARVAAQSFTILSMTIGCIILAGKEEK